MCFRRFSGPFCEISKNTFFTEHLWATTSVHANHYEIGNFHKHTKNTQKHTLYSLSDMTSFSALTLHLDEIQTNNLYKRRSNYQGFKYFLNT